MDEHKGEEYKGRMKEAVGDITDDPGLKREGKVDEASAHTKDAVGNAAEKVKEVVNPHK